MKKTNKVTRIELAEGDKIKLYRPEVEVILEALGHPEALVTNESQVRDFTTDEKRLEQFSVKLGFAVGVRDYIWQLAKQYRARKTER